MFGKPMRERSRNVALRRVAAVAAIAVGLLTPGSPANSANDESVGRYVALVVGIGNYQGTLGLTQPAADAASIANAFRVRGFQIVSFTDGRGCAENGPVIDLNRAALLAAIACLSKAAERATQAVFYFSGHSVTRNGQNYLLPAGIAADDAARSDELVDLKSVLLSLEKARPDLSVVILDAARSAAKDIADTTPGLALVAPTTAISRIIAFSAKAGTWADASKPSRPSKDRQDADDTSLSPYTRYLGQLIQDDLEGRSLGVPGGNFDALLVQAAKYGSPPREIMNENAAGAEVIGRIPQIGKSTCDVMNWRTETFGHCIEIAATYERCGKNAALRMRLQNQCASDWKMLVRQSLRASMVSAMKTKSCASLKDLLTKFETEPGGRDLDEFKEVQSLAQYTCATEKDRQASTSPAPPSNANAKRGSNQRSESERGSTTEFLFGDNRDIWGQDIPAADGTIGFASADIESCTKECQSTDSCVAISFDRWKRKCYPKNRVVSALLDARSTIAVKKPLQVPSVSGAKAEFQTMRNSRFSGDPYLRKRVSDFAACRSSCEGGGSVCVGFGFLKSAARNLPNCELFKLTNASNRDLAVDSGFKFQSP